MLSAQAATGRFRTCLPSSVWMPLVTAPRWLTFRRVKKLRWGFLPVPIPNKRKMWFSSEMFFEEVILSQTPWNFSFDFDLFNWLVFTKVHTYCYFFFFSCACVVFLNVCMCVCMYAGRYMFVYAGVQVEDQGSVARVSCSVTLSTFYMDAVSLT